MIQSRDELIMEMTKEYGLNRMGENDDDEDEDDDDEGNSLAPPAPIPAVVPEGAGWFGQLGWSGWWSKWRPLWHGWVIFQRWE
jgi:hypothetical protein